MTKPEINQELFQKIRDQFVLHPETHAQRDWESYATCGTQRCVAGWALHFHKPHQDIDTTRKEVLYTHDKYHFNLNGGYEESARIILGLTPDEATRLFYEMDDSAARRMVELYALKGRNRDLA
ncbi:hypothetical protein BJP40_06475 [Streptomyces sp. CC53]|uniref:hypothetical protein n=1 Tax=Streptomyces sp. CC53 TaxID=1906740 RepID=UPI0008DD9C9C|nr:hypothetical protein [Streptomyces sp. CC53]OII61168.1 hypothetical protein BJP40_06475 [Streptomyces sp. CC53]